MNTSGVIQKLLDELATLIEKLQSYIDRTLEILNQVRDWINDIIHALGEGFDYVMSLITGKESTPQLHASHPHDSDLLFV